MSEWIKFRLNEVVEYFIDYRGRTPIKTDFGIPLITAKIVKNGTIEPPNEFIAEDNYLSWMTRGFPKVNDVVLTTEAPLGEVALLKDERVALAQRIITLRCYPDKCYNPFLKYYLQSPTGQEILQSHAQGSVVEGIKSAVLKELEIEIPPLSEQKAIAEVLGSLDDKIELLHQQNKTLEALAETLFRQWFVEGATEVTTTLGSFAENVRDNAKVSDLLNYDHYVALEHIDKKSIALTNWSTPEDVASNKSIFLKNDILFGKLRSYFHKVCISPIDGICSTDILVIRPKKQDWLSFVLFWFFSDDVVQHSDMASGGTRMPRTSWDVLRNFEIPVPDLKLVVEFDKATRPMLERIRSNIFEIRTLTTIRDELLPKLMSGEVQVG